MLNVIQLMNGLTPFEWLNWKLNNYGIDGISICILQSNSALFFVVGLPNCWRLKNSADWECMPSMNYYNSIYLVDHIKRIGLVDLVEFIWFPFWREKPMNEFNFNKSTTSKPILYVNYSSVGYSLHSSWLIWLKFISEMNWNQSIRYESEIPKFQYDFWFLASQSIIQSYFIYLLN